MPSRQVVRSYAGVAGALRAEHAAHTDAAIRESAARWITPTALEDWRRAAQALADALCSKLRERDRFDLVGDLARPFGHDLARIVTACDAPVALAESVFEAACDPEDCDRTAEASEATLRLARCFDGPDAALRLQAFVALTQTLPCFLGAAWRTLIEAPDAFAWLRERPDGMDGAVEEFLRLAGPAQLLVRPGARLAVAAANRDGSVFREPDRLDLERRGPPHLALGLGAHACAGAAVVRAATAAATAGLLHFEGLTLDGPPLPRGGSAIAGLASLPVRQTANRRMLR